MQRNIHATRSGTGRRPQLTSNERRAKPEETHLRDFSGAKLARKAAAKTLTLKH